MLAHDNVFNRWVAGEDARYFADADGCARALATVLDDEAALEAMRQASYARHAEAFTWDRVLPAYEAVLLRALRM